MLRYKVIVNPTAGRGAGGRAIPEIVRLLDEHGLDFDLVETERPWHAAELAQQAAGDGYDVVVAVGGDGTANEVLNGLMAARAEGVDSCALGVLCTGRGNDFAYGMGIPQDLAAACQVLAQGARRRIDVGHVTGGRYPEGRYFGNGIGIGFDAVVGFVAKDMRRLSGFASYIVAVFKTVFLYYQAPLTEIVLEEETITQPSLMVSVMNGRRMGGGFMMAPTSEPDDGLFDLCIAQEVGRARIFGLIPHFLRGTQATQRSIRMERARRVVVTAQRGELPAHGDGETLSRQGLQLTIELVPRALDVVCPPPELST
jgi:YegS/Rv2252/BmrU family lipid kinase